MEDDHANALANQEVQGIEDMQAEYAVEEYETCPGRYQISSYGWDPDVDALVKRLKRGDIHIPGFQRDFIWKPEQKSRFVESLILGLPVPNIFLAVDSRKKTLTVVDGQQRLRSLFDYLEGKFSLSRTGIQEELRGCYFSSDVARSPSSKVLAASDARTLSDAVLHTIVIKPDPIHDDPNFGHEYNQAVIQLFHRLNTSGTPLNAQEIRASIFHGPLYDLLDRLNEDEAWRELYGKPHPRMIDVEHILRFIALRKDYQAYRPPMPRFLDEFMEKHRNIKEDEAREIEDSFRKVARLIRDTIGKDGLSNRSRLSAFRFDAIAAGIDTYCARHAEPSHDEIIRLIRDLEKDENYQWSIREFVSQTERVKTRIEQAKSIFGA